MTEAFCEHVGTKYDHRAECGNRARWVTDSGTLLCGRHLRYASRVKPWTAKR